MREQEIEATPTSRIHRITHGRWKIRPLRDRSTKTELVDRQTHMPTRQREVMHHYKYVMQALARSERGEDRQLAVDLVHYLQG